MTRLFCGEVQRVIGGFKRMAPAATTGAATMDKRIAYLHEHRARINSRTRPRAGYPLGSGVTESSNKFIGHVRRKRSGVWWYCINSNSSSWKI